jgi:hypothetical protein
MAAMPKTFVVIQIYIRSDNAVKNSTLEPGN